MHDNPRISESGESKVDDIPLALKSAPTRFAVLLDTLCSAESENELQEPCGAALVVPTAILSAVVMAGGLGLGYPILTLSGVGIGAAAVSLKLYLYVSAHKVVQQYSELFSIAREELGGLAEQVHEYLFNLDARTSRYFHCVTTTKITTYFMLRQIESGLADVVNQLARACRKNSRAEALAALRMLRAPFFYRDSFLCNSGSVYQILLRDLPSRVAYLTDSLELNIRELERELTAWKETAFESDSR